MKKNPAEQGGIVLESEQYWALSGMESLVAEPFERVDSKHEIGEAMTTAEGVVEHEFNGEMNAQDIRNVAYMVEKYATNERHGIARSAKRRSLGAFLFYALEIKDDEFLDTTKDALNAGGRWWAWREKKILKSHLKDLAVLVDM